MSSSSIGTLERLDGQRYRYTAAHHDVGHVGGDKSDDDGTFRNASEGLLAYRNRQRATIEKQQCLRLEGGVQADYGGCEAASGPPMASLLLKWQTKCDHLTSKLESEQLRSEELMDECHRLRTHAKEHAHDTDELEDRVKKLTEHLERTTQTHQDDINTLQREIQMMQQLRSSDIARMADQQRKISELETALMRFRSKETVDVSTQVSVASSVVTSPPSQPRLGSVYNSIFPSNPTREEDISSAYAMVIRQPSVPSFLDDCVISRVASLPRSDHPHHLGVGDAVPEQQRPQHRFVHSIQQSVMSDPELSEALGELLLTNKRQRTKNKLIGHGFQEWQGAKQPPPDVAPQVPVKELGPQVPKYKAHEGLNANPFDTTEEVELALHHRPSSTGNGNVVALLDSSPKAQRPVPVPVAASSSEKRSTSFRPRVVTPTTSSEAHIHLGSLFSKGARVSPHPPAPEQLCRISSFQSSIELSAPVSPHLISTVVSSASSSETNSPRSPKEMRLQQHRSGRHQQQGGGCWYDLDPQPVQFEQPTDHKSVSLSPRQVDTTAQRSSNSIGSFLVKSPSPMQPSTPLPPTPSSQSPLRSKESVDRIEKLRSELQYLIDMRTRLQLA